MSEAKKYRVEGPHGAVVVVRVGGPPGMSERHWKQRTRSGELTVPEELGAQTAPAKKKSE